MLLIAVKKRISQLLQVCLVRAAPLPIILGGVEYTAVNLERELQVYETRHGRIPRPISVGSGTLCAPSEQDSRHQRVVKVQEQRERALGISSQIRWVPMRGRPVNLTRSVRAPPRVGGRPSVT